MPGAGKCHEEARASGHGGTSRTGPLGHAANITLMGLRLTTNLTEDQRHDEWARIIRRIAEEHVGQAWSNYMFRLTLTHARGRTRRRAGPFEAVDLGVMSVRLGHVERIGAPRLNRERRAPGRGAL